MPVWRSSTAETSARPPWNASTTAYTPTRLHVETSIASETCSPRSISPTSLGTSAAGKAARSSPSPGGLRWGSPPTRTVMTPPPRGRARRRSCEFYPVHRVPVDGGGLGAARDVEREDLQLHGEVALAGLDAARPPHHHRREVEDAAHARRDELVAHRLGGLPGRGDHADR